MPVPTTMAGTVVRTVASAADRGRSAMRGSRASPSWLMPVGDERRQRHAARDEDAGEDDLDARTRG